LKAAEEIGALVARKGWVLVSGGRSGVMEAGCRGARAAGGLTIGILPDEDLESETRNHYISVVIPTGMGFARNAVNVLSCDALVAIGGQEGTLSEIAYSVVYGKPLIAIDCPGAYAVKELLEHADIHRANNPEDAMNKLEKRLGQLLMNRLKTN
jgi:uncharacterized protein (TIGR00725 family)